jgi:hypothetical protein
MKVISTESDYSVVESSAEYLFDKNKTLPENVFLPRLVGFLFITFDELFMPVFFNHLKNFLRAIGENSFWVASIEPDSKIYFGAHFGFFGFEFFVSDSERDYLDALHSYPEASPADALVHNSNLLMISSATGRWAIYGDRAADLAICAFDSQGRLDTFKEIYGDDLLGGVKVAADYAYGVDKTNPLKEKFCNCYRAF